MENLYQDALKAHYKSPVGLDCDIKVSHHFDGYNASCGDEISVFLRIGNAHIIDIAFKTDSCAICTASASILCQLSVGISLAALKSDYQNLKQRLNNQSPEEISLDPSKFECLLPVSHHPSRINCALLPWQTAVAAINSPVEIKQAVPANA